MKPCHFEPIFWDLISESIAEESAESIACEQAGHLRSLGMSVCIDAVVLPAVDRRDAFEYQHCELIGLLSEVVRLLRENP